MSIVFGPRGVQTVGIPRQRKLGPPNFGVSCGNTKNSRAEQPAPHHSFNMAARTLRIGKGVNCTMKVHKVSEFVD